MEAKRNVIVGNSTISHAPAWETAKQWAKESLSEDAMAGAYVTAATLVISSFLWLVVSQGLQHYTIAGF